MPFRLAPPRDRKLHRLVKESEPRSLGKGVVLYGPGDPADEVFLVREGVVKLTLPGLERGSRERAVCLALPWEVFGDEALIAGTRRYAAIVARPCVVHGLPPRSVLRGLRTASKSLAAYLEAVEREMHRLRHCQSGSRGPDAAQRLAEVLLDLAQRCGEREKRAVRLGVRLTHQILADLAGSHRATVTTLLNDWLYEGHLDTDEDGRLVLAKPRGLLELAGFSSPAEPAISTG